MTIREQLEARERATLSPRAALSATSRGRAVSENEHEYRTCFQRDRDRILHSKAFRRLKRKTQVFLAAQDDHYRTRLTHTLEVSQIARCAARSLSLNEDLTEAIALGHDLGHAPFGHAGESVLNDVYSEGFVHSEHSVRIVEKLEQRRTGVGLNLSIEVIEGIRNHSRGKVILLGRPSEGATTLEADLVSVCDAIAYINHDIDDAIRAGLITSGDLPQEPLKTLGKATSQRIDAMVTGLIQGSENGRIDITSEVRDATQALRSFLYNNVYPCEPIRSQVNMASKLLRELYDYFVKNPTQDSLAGDSNDSVERRTVDFIAGMTDQYAVQVYQSCFLPSAWRL